jgi:Mg2+/Co2+ transporter CorB
METLNVRIGFDNEAGVWVTERSQVPGLTAIDDTREGLLRQVHDVTPELLQLSVGSGRIETSPSYEVRILEWELNWDLSDDEATRTASLIDKFRVEIPQRRAAE